MTLAAALLAAAVVGGCSKSADELRAARGGPQPLRMNAPAGSAGAPVDPDWVSAVSTSSSLTPITLKFRIDRRPQVGQPVRVVLVLLPANEVQIDHLYASVATSDGLQLLSDRAFDAADLSAGVALQHEITVMPQQAGVLNITTTILVDSNLGSIARTYSIPLIAANGAS